MLRLYAHIVLRENVGLSNIIINYYLLMMVTYRRYNMNRDFRKKSINYATIVFYLLYDIFSLTWKTNFIVIIEYQSSFNQSI